jgi:hypothetical protein
MTVKLILLKSGEDVIADVSEMYAGEKNLVGYLFDNPCAVKLRRFTPESDGREGYQIGLSSWVPLSKDSKIPVPMDWVITIVEPIDKLMEMYTSEVENRKKENDEVTFTDK